MERRQLNKKVIFRCRKIKSLSCPRMNEAQIAAFKLENINTKINYHLHKSKKRSSEPSFSQTQSIKQNIQRNKIQLSELSAYDSFAVESSSKTTQKKGKKSLGQFLQKIEQKQQKILEILERKHEGKECHDNCFRNSEGELQNHKSIRNNLQKKTSKNNLRIRQVFCQKINCKFDKNNQQKKGSLKKRVLFQINGTNKQTDGQRQNLPPFLAKIMLQAFGVTKNFKPAQCEEQNLKKLLSLRLYIHQWTFSDFIEKLLEFEEGEVSIQQLQSIFMNIPFLMTEKTYHKALLLIFNKKEEQIKSKFPVSYIAQIMRKYIQDYPKISPSDKETQTKQLKFFIEGKKEQLVTKIQKKTFQQNTISITSLEEVLEQSRLNKSQIHLFLGYISVSFENLSSIPYKLLFENKWLKQLS